MANPATTHVIEIESGIGEPAFIPLSMGQELQPISVGKKGMWRIESPRVLDVHAFVYFDGSSLFLQSADESNAASVDGFRVGGGQVPKLMHQQVQQRHRLGGIGQHQGCAGINAHLHVDQRRQRDFDQMYGLLHYVSQLNRNPLG